MPIQEENDKLWNKEKKEKPKPDDIETPTHNTGSECHSPFNQKK